MRHVPDRAVRFAPDVIGVEAEVVPHVRIEIGQRPALTPGLERCGDEDEYVQPPDPGGAVRKDGMCHDESFPNRYVTSGFDLAA